MDIIAPNFTCLFVFDKDTKIGALTHHSAPFTGSVECVVPAGTMARLSSRMNLTSHFIKFVTESVSVTWIESVQAKAKAESPIPERCTGGLAFFVSIKTLLSDAVRFLPSEDVDLKSVIERLKEEYREAKRCAIQEESEEFKRKVREGICSPELSDKARAELLKD